MYCVAITGSIASGKSTVAARFKTLGVDVIKADDVAKHLTTTDKPAFNQIVKHFGRSILDKNGDLNRPRLRELIIAESCERSWLENLLHPLIRTEIINQVNQSTTPYCVIEIPLLRSKRDYPYLNRILLVSLASEEEQCLRLIKRDKHTPDEALALLKTQPTHQEYLAIADDQLINDGTLTELYEKVDVLHKFYLDDSVLNI